MEEEEVTLGVWVWAGAGVGVGDQVGQQFGGLESLSKTRKSVLATF